MHHGRTVKRTGDGSIIEFRSVVDAVRCAIEAQSGMAIRNAGVPAEDRIEFRVGRLCAGLRLASLREKSSPAGGYFRCLNLYVD
jgi:hypothetical protein